MQVLYSLSYVMIFFMILDLHLLAVKAAKWVISRISHDQATTDRLYEKLFLLHKRVRVAIFFNRFAKAYHAKQVLPILRLASRDQGHVTSLDSEYSLMGQYQKNDAETTKIFVLAAGQAVRWQKSHYKQLAEYQGKPIIEHMLATCPNAVVLTQHPPLWKYNHAVPSRHYFVLDTILSSHQEWRQRNIFLLGDVYYHPDDLQQIINYQGDLAIFGSKKQVEIFAISFSASAKDMVIKHLALAIIDAYEGGRGKIWEMYHSLAGLPLYKIGFGKYFVELNRTTDVDTLDDYERLLTNQDFKQPI